jgi:hypothetical protein
MKRLLSAPANQVVILGAIIQNTQRQLASWASTAPRKGPVAEKISVKILTPGVELLT